MKKFSHPMLFAIICKKFSPSLARLEQKLNREFKKRRLNIVALQFKVEDRYLDNLLTCMKLMDVVGFFDVSKVKKYPSFKL